METEIKKPDIQVKTYPDNSTFYYFNFARDQLDRKKFSKILMTEAILLLLYAQADKPINGRISLMKQTFLVAHEILNKENVQNGRFVKHYFGWYSFQVTNDIKNLEFLGLISRKGKANTKSEQFQITESGKNRISELFNSLSPFLQNTLRDKRKGWDQLGCDGILKYMYQMYPDSIEKSKLKERYKPIKWGKSKA